MRIGSLCSGYAGLDMAVEDALGATTAWFCEYDRDPSAILAHHWPQLKALGNGVVPRQAVLALRTLLPLAEAS